MMNNIKVKKIYRSKRRTFGLEVTSQGELIVRAPLVVPESKIFNFINSKRAWILVKQKFIKERLKKATNRKFVEGEEILFLGKAYRLKISNKDTIALSEYLEFPRTFLKSPKKHLAEWYRVSAQKVISERCAYYSRKMGLKYNNIKINSAMKRLGSCGPRNSLNFSWLLMLSPQRVIDYVVVHELCHLEIKNHSAEFWNKVKTCLPNYLEQKKWLKLNSSKLIGY